VVKRITLNARDDIDQIASYISIDDLHAAVRFVDCALNTFFEKPDELIPRKVFPEFSETIRALTVQGFSGYIVYYAEMRNGLYMLAVVAPGISDVHRQRTIGIGLDDAREGAYE